MERCGALRSCRTIQEIDVIKLFAFLVTILAAGPALADSACDKPHDDFDGLYCLNKVYQQADADLNATFGRLKPKLDASGQKALRSGQLAWISARNERCGKRDSTGFYVNLSCATETTITRTKFLEDRLRECVSSGCRDSLLQ